MSPRFMQRAEGSASDEAAVMADPAVVAAAWSEAVTIEEEDES